MGPDHKTSSSRARAIKHTLPLNWGYVEKSTTKQSQGSRIRSIFKIMHLKGKRQTGGLLICGWLQDNSDPPLTPKTNRWNHGTSTIHHWSLWQVSNIQWRKIKCYKKKWYLLEFLSDSSGKWRLAYPYLNLTIDYWNGRQMIKQIFYYQDSWIIGIWIPPNGSSQEHISQLRKTTTSWVDRFRLGKIRI